MFEPECGSCHKTMRQVPDENGQPYWRCETCGATQGQNENENRQDPEHQYHEWSVMVGNVGTVCSGADEDEAREIYGEYVEESKDRYGRAYGEDVTLFQAGEIVEEYEGHSHNFDVKIEFNTGNAAFDDDYEIYRILNIIADRMRPLQDDSGNIVDVNGNTVGKWSVE